MAFARSVIDSRAYCNCCTASDPAQGTACVRHTRKYGNPVVLDLRGRSQLALAARDQNLCNASKLGAAKWISDSIGEIEVERSKKSRCMGGLGSNQSILRLGDAII